MFSYGTSPKKLNGYANMVSGPPIAVLRAGQSMTIVSKIEPTTPFNVFYAGENGAPSRLSKCLGLFTSGTETKVKFVSRKRCLPRRCQSFQILSSALWTK